MWSAVSFSDGITYTIGKGFLKLLIGEFNLDPKSPVESVETTEKNSFGLSTLRSKEQMVGQTVPLDSFFGPIPTGKES